MLQRVYRFARDPAFEGRVAFLEDYDKHVAHRLVEGVDLWLNLPRVPMEACGTSGMKAALNGVPQLGTLDGWWAEGYNGKNGWAIPRVAYQTDADQWDVNEFYRLMEQDVVPAYYERDTRGIPAAWVERMRHALQIGGRHFTARRMVQQYVREYYVPSLRGDPHDDPPTA
jgi:starch phosphorylase